jgi:Protein of unknown function (DUF2971)
MVMFRIPEVLLNVDDLAILKLFDPLYEGLGEDDFPRRRPYLAHYTSLDTLEKILSNNEMWFSNPLLMNDWEEVRFGVNYGTGIVKQSDAIGGALGSQNRRDLFVGCLDTCVNFFQQTHLHDTYVFCLSEWDANFPDGLLSMWRGYGGNGKGVAIVFDTSKLNLAPDTSPLILARVHYGSENSRIKWLQENVAEKSARIIAKNQIPDDKLIFAAHAIFQRIRLFALYTKHLGFSEEREWRVVYIPERDPGGVLKPMMHYTNGPRGIEPKLKFKIAPLAGITSGDLSLDDLVASIILGPTLSTALAKQSVARMLELIKKPHLQHQLQVSTIPFRSRVD